MSDEKKLYVGGLPYSTTEDSLRAAFGQAGTVTAAQIIMDKMTGRSKGFGFVEMSSNEEAQAAIEMFHGKDFEGRNLTVNIARPKEEGGARRPSFGGNRGGFGGGSRGGDRGGRDFGGNGYGSRDRQSW